MFSVQDTGIGIKDEDKERIFRLFGNMEGNSNKINPAGIGLGLTICSKILGKLGSELQIKSQINKGSNFYFCLNLKVF